MESDSIDDMSSNFIYEFDHEQSEVTKDSGFCSLIPLYEDPKNPTSLEIKMNHIKRIIKDRVTKENVQQFKIKFFHILHPVWVSEKVLENSIGLDNLDDLMQDMDYDSHPSDYE